MAGFVQIIEFTTSRIEEIRALGERFADERTRSGDGYALRATYTADHDRPGHYVSIVEFESYDAAMKNSELPETTDFATSLAELCDGPPAFRNLDVVQVWQP